MLFKVFAYSCPLHKLSGSRGELIGRVVATSKITTSLWGDQQLFYKHQRIEDDLKVFPWWSDYLQHWSNGRMDETPMKFPPPVEKCPFGFLFDL